MNEIWNCVSGALLAEEKKKKRKSLSETNAMQNNCTIRPNQQKMNLIDVIATFFMSITKLTKLRVN